MLRVYLKEYEVDINFIEITEEYISKSPTSKKVESENEGEAGVVVYDNVNLTLRYDEAGNNIIRQRFRHDVNSFFDTKKRYIIRIDKMFGADRSYEATQIFEGIVDFQSISYHTNRDSNGVEYIVAVSFDVIDKISSFATLSSDAMQRQNVNSVVTSRCSTQYGVDNIFTMVLDDSNAFGLNLGEVIVIIGGQKTWFNSSAVLDLIHNPIVFNQPIIQKGEAFSPFHGGSPIPSGLENLYYGRSYVCSDAGHGSTYVVAGTTYVVPIYFSWIKADASPYNIYKTSQGMGNFFTKYYYWFWRRDAWWENVWADGSGDLNVWTTDIKVTKTYYTSSDICIYGTDIYGRNVAKGFDAFKIIEEIIRSQWSSFTLIKRVNALVWDGSKYVAQVDGSNNPIYLSEYIFPLEYAGKMVDTYPIGEESLDALKSLADMLESYLYVDSDGNFVLQRKKGLGVGNTSALKTINFHNWIDGVRKPFWDKLADGVEIYVKTWLLVDESDFTSGYLDGGGSAYKDPTAKPKNVVVKNVFLQDTSTITSDMTKDEKIEAINTIADEIAAEQLLFYGYRHDAYGVSLKLEYSEYFYDIIDFFLVDSKRWFIDSLEMDEENDTLSFQLVSKDGYNYDYSTVNIAKMDESTGGYGGNSGSSVAFSRTGTSSGDNLLWSGTYIGLNVSMARSNLLINNVENIALSTWTGNTYLNTLGTIVTGVWHGTVIDGTYINYNTTNLRVTSNSLNTIQDIATTSSPSFNGITVKPSPLVYNGVPYTAPNIRIEGMSIRDSITTYEKSDQLLSIDRKGVTISYTSQHVKYGTPPALFDGNAGTDFTLQPSLITVLDPFIMTIEGNSFLSHPYYEALFIFTENSGWTGSWGTSYASFTNWAFELKGDSDGLWYTILDRTGVVDYLNNLAIPVMDWAHPFFVAGNRMVNGIRITVRGCNSYNVGYDQFNWAGFHYYVATYTSSSGNALSLAGGTLYGQVNSETILPRSNYTYNLGATNQAYYGVFSYNYFQNGTLFLNENRQLINIYSLQHTSNHFIISSNGTEGTIQLSNGGNWGLLMRGIGNTPVMGAYEGGSLSFAGFSAGDMSAYNSPTMTINFANNSVGINTSTLAEKLNLAGHFNQQGNYSLYNNFYSGWTGTGWRLDYGLTTPSFSTLEVDNLWVRGTMHVYELVINQIRATNGSLYVSSSAKIASFDISDPYNMIIVFDDPDEVARGVGLCPFLENDIAIIQRVDLNSTTPIKQIFLKVIAVSGKQIQFEFLGTPVGSLANADVVVRIGNTINTTRQGSLYLTSDDSNAPYMDVMNDVASVADWKSTNKLKLRLGKLTGITSVNFGTLSGYGMYGKGGLYLESAGTTDSIAMRVDSTTAQLTMKRAGNTIFDFNTATSTAKIAGWTITNIDLTSPTISYAGKDNNVKLVADASGGMGAYVNMDFNIAAVPETLSFGRIYGSTWENSYGLAFITANNQRYFELTNTTKQIAGWVFDTEKFYKNNVRLESSAAIKGLVVKDSVEDLIRIGEFSYVNLSYSPTAITQSIFSAYDITNQTLANLTGAGKWESLGAIQMANNDLYSGESYFAKFKETVNSKMYLFFQPQQGVGSWNTRATQWFDDLSFIKGKIIEIAFNLCFYTGYDYTEHGGNFKVDIVYELTQTGITGQHMVIRQNLFSGTQPTLTAGNYTEYDKTGVNKFTVEVPYFLDEWQSQWTGKIGLEFSFGELSQNSYNDQNGLNMGIANLVINGYTKNKIDISQDGFEIWNSPNTYLKFRNNIYDISASGLKINGNYVSQFGGTVASNPLTPQAGMLVKNTSTGSWHITDGTIQSNGTANWDELALGGSGGEVNTGSSLGTGADVFKQKSGVNLEFRSLLSGSTSGLTLTENANDITFALVFGTGSGQVAEGNHTHSGYQTADADLTAIAALGFTSSALLRKTAVNTWTLDTNTYLTANQTITLSGDLSGNGTTSISGTVTGIRGASVPVLTTGYLRYTGSAWEYKNETYSLSSHNHTGVYAPVSHTHPATQITAGIFQTGSYEIQGDLTVDLITFNSNFISVASSNDMYLVNSNSYGIWNDYDTATLYLGNFIAGNTNLSIVDSSSGGFNFTAIGATAKIRFNLDALTGSRVLELDSSKYVIAAVKQTGYNLALGTTSGTVAEGNHSHSYSLDGLSNVTITSNSIGEILVWSGTYWYNRTLNEANIVGTNSGAQTLQGALTFATMPILGNGYDANGSIVFQNSYESYYGTLLSAAQTVSHKTWTLPNASGTIALVGHTHTESDLSLSDNTTGDFNTSRHGFVPKSTNTNYFLRGDGTWVAVSAGGGDAYLGNNQTFSGINTFTNDIILGNGYNHGQLKFLDDGGSYVGKFLWGGTTGSDKVWTLPSTSGIILISNAAMTIQSNADGFQIAGGTTSRTLTVSGANKTIAGTGLGLTLTGAFVGTFTFTNTTSVTFPTSGTLVNSTHTQAYNYGGTGLTSIAQGDLLYGSSASAYSRLTKSTTANQFLKNSGTSNNPAWAGIAQSDIAFSGTATYIPYFSSSTALTTSANFLYNASTGKLSIGGSVNGSVSLTEGTGSFSASMYMVGDEGNMYLTTTDVAGLISTNRQIYSSHSFKTNGQLILDAGTTNADGLNWGSDTYLYRGAAGSLTLSGTNSTLIIDATTYTTNSYLSFQQNGTSKMWLGIAHSTNALITGSIAEDTCLRTSGGKMLFSVDNGTTSILTVSYLQMTTTVGFTANGAIKSNTGFISSNNNTGITVTQNILDDAYNTIELVFENGLLISATKL